MTCGWTGVCRPAFRKAPSSNYRKLPSYPLYDEFWRKTTHFLLFFANFRITYPCLWKICRKRDPCLENLGPKNPPIWAAHTRTLNMLCTPRGFHLPSERRKKGKTACSLRVSFLIQSCLHNYFFSSLRFRYEES